MALNRMWLSVGVLGVVLGLSGVSTASAQERSRSRDRDRTEHSGGEARRSGGGQAVERGSSDNRGRDNRRADNQRPRDDHRGDDRRADNRNWRNDGRNGGWDHRDGNGYRGPRVVVVPRPLYPRHYGSGGRYSVFFGIGSGYRYGSPYSGRVYGAIGPVYGGARLYYGDVRLQVRPRDAAVYVDGYYAGIVDDFDGAFQRLTLQVGPHDVEIEVPGGQPQAFHIYVDPARTVDLRADLYPR
jgi:hypothetical protein